MTSFKNLYYIINDGNEREYFELSVDPIKFTELNENNTDMYIGSILVKFCDV